MLTSAPHRSVTSQLIDAVGVTVNGPAKS